MTNSAPVDHNRSSAIRERDSGDFNIAALDLISPGKWLGKEPPEHEWIVTGWAHAGAVTLLAGDGGTGKSQLALQLMYSCALGEPFLGLETAKCNSLGVFCEDSLDELQRRTYRMNETFGASADAARAHSSSFKGW